MAPVLAMDQGGVLLKGKIVGLPPSVELAGDLKLHPLGLAVEDGRGPRQLPGRRSKPSASGPPSAKVRVGVFEDLQHRLDQADLEMLDNVALAGQPVVARRLLADDPEVVAHFLNDLAVEGAFRDLAHRELHEHALEVHVRQLLLPLGFAPAEAFEKFALKSFGGVALGQSALRR